MTVASLRTETARLARRAGLRLQEALLAFRRDEVDILSAALVYYSALSVVPLLLMLMAVPGLLLRFSDAPQAVIAETLGLAEAALGPEFRALLERSLADLQRESLIASLVALAALLYSASLAFRHISRCFRQIWRPGEPIGADVGEVARKTVVARLIDRVVGLLMVLGLSGALILSVLAGAVNRLLQRALDRLPLIGDLAGWAVDPALTLALSALVFMLVLKLVPPVRVRWRDVWPSALICAVGWQVGKQALLLYIFLIGTRSSYGALSVILAVLFWFYANGLILFFGAELCKVTAQGRAP